MAFLDRLRDMINGPVDEEEEEEDFYGVYEEDFEENRARRRNPDYDNYNNSYDEENADFVDTRPRQRIDKDNKVVSIHTTAQLQVVIVKPTRFEEVVDIADHLVEKRTVVLNLEQTSKEITRRIVDFLCGAAYAHNGQLKRIANNTYIITPFNVGLIGADVLGELENNGVFF